MRKRPGLQTLQEGGLVSITSVGQYRSGKQPSSDASVDDLQGDLPFGLDRYIPLQWLHQLDL